MKRATSVFVAMALGLFAHDAAALCPNCLAQSQSFPPKLRLVGAFLLLPFLIALIALRQIRRLHRRFSPSSLPPHRQSERSERV